MKGPILFPLLLLSFSQAVYSQVFCIQAITKTMSYLPALTLHDGACPTNSARGIEYYAVGSAGCCTSSATAKTLNTEGIACCPCGAFCTGYMPEVQDWTTDAAGALLVSTTISGKPTETTLATTTDTTSTASMFHGPHTATNSSAAASSTAPLSTSLSSPGSSSTPGQAVSNISSTSITSQASLGPSKGSSDSSSLTFSSAQSATTTSSSGCGAVGVPGVFAGIVAVTLSLLLR